MSRSRVANIALTVLIIVVILRVLLMLLTRP